MSNIGILIIVLIVVAIAISASTLIFIGSSDEEDKARRIKLRMNRAFLIIGFLVLCATIYFLAEGISRTNEELKKVQLEKRLLQKRNNSLTRKVGLLNDSLGSVYRDLETYKSSYDSLGDKMEILLGEVQVTEDLGQQNKMLKDSLERIYDAYKRLKNNIEYSIAKRDRMYEEMSTIQDSLEYVADSVVHKLLENQLVIGKLTADVKAQKYIIKGLEEERRGDSFKKSEKAKRKRAYQEAIVFFRRANCNPNDSYYTRVVEKLNKL